MNEVSRKEYKFVIDDKGEMIKRFAGNNGIAKLQYLMEKEETDIAETYSFERDDEPEERYSFIEGLRNRIVNAIISLKLIKIDAFGYRVRLRYRSDIKPHFIFGIYRPEDWLSQVDMSKLNDDQTNT